MRLSAYLGLSLLLLALAGCGADSSSPASNSNGQTPQTPDPAPTPGLPDDQDDDDDDIIPPENSDPLSFRPNNGTPATGCQATADASADDLSLGNTGQTAHYSLDDLSDASSGTDWTGTWVVTASGNLSASVATFQRYLLVIRKNIDDDYEIANCSAMATTTTETVLQWFNQYGQPVSASDPTRDHLKEVVIAVNYDAWEPFMPQSDAQPNTFSFPLYTFTGNIAEAGITLSGVDSDYSHLSSSDGEYAAQKISLSTTPLGNVTGRIGTTDYAYGDVWCMTQMKMVAASCPSTGGTTQSVYSTMRFSATGGQLASGSNSTGSGLLLLARTVLAGPSSSAGVSSAFTSDSAQSTSITTNGSTYSVQIALSNGSTLDASVLTPP